MALISPSGPKSFNSSRYAPGKGVKPSWTGQGETVAGSAQTSALQVAERALSVLSSLRLGKGPWG